MMTPLPPVFVISLTTATQRREKMAAQLNRLNIPFQFFDAVNGKSFAVNTMPLYNGVKRRAFFGRDMTGGEIGCLMSHAALAQKIIDENISCAIILEDDAVLSDDFPCVVRDIQKSAYPWEIIRFLGSPKVTSSRQRPVAMLSSTYRITRLSTAPGGTHAYFLTHNAARKLVRAFSHVYLPVDMIMSRPWLTGISLLTVQPGLATQDLSLESSIGIIRDNKTPDDLKGVWRMAYPISRGVFKLSDTLMRRIVYWGAWWQDRVAIKDA